MKIAWGPHTVKGGLRCASSSLPMVSRIAFRQQPANTCPKQFSTVPALRESIAAPEIDFRSLEEGRIKEKETAYIRLVPQSPSYFTAQPTYTDNLLHLLQLEQRYSSLPKVKPGEAPRIAWRNLAEYRSAHGETVKSSKYHQILNALNQLNQIHPSMRPADVIEALNQHKRVIDPYKNRTKPIFIDSMGKALGVGRRKSSTARAWVIEGTGEILVNGKTLAEMFGRIHDRESAIWPLKATERIDKYNVWALVSGGGTTGQAEALTLAVAKALMGLEPALKPALRRGKRHIPAHNRKGHKIFGLLSKVKNHANVIIRSRLRYSRHEESREEEARQAQGQKDACLG